MTMMRVGSGSKSVLGCADVFKFLSLLGWKSLWTFYVVFVNVQPHLLYHVARCFLPGGLSPGFIA